MTEKNKELKITVVQIEEFSDPDFKPPSNWYFKNAMGEFVFVSTSKREVVQEYIDENYGKDKYKPIAVKDQKTKSRQEGGGLTCYGSNSRKGFAPQLRKTN